MNGFYSRAMRGATVILFALAMLIPIVSFIVAFSTYATPNSGEFGPMSSGGVPSNLLLLVGAFVNGLNNAVWPFFGAALLWRLDRYVISKDAVE